MPRKTNPQRYPAPISLRDVVEALSLPVLQAVVSTLPGGVVLAPKAREQWRVVFGEAMVIGYTTSAVIAGTEIGTMRALAQRIRQASTPTQQQHQAAHHAAMSMIGYIRRCVAREDTLQAERTMLGALLTQWAGLDPLAGILAHEVLVENAGDRVSQIWYSGVARSLLFAYGMGMTSGLDLETLGALPEYVQLFAPGRGDVSSDVATAA